MGGVEDLEGVQEKGQIYLQGFKEEIQERKKRFAEADRVFKTLGKHLVEKMIQ